jgi:hypothetical protein
MCKKLHCKCKQVDNQLPSSKTDLQQKDFKIKPIKYNIKI